MSIWRTSHMSHFSQDSTIRQKKWCASEKCRSFIAFTLAQKFTTALASATHERMRGSKRSSHTQTHSHGMGWGGKNNNISRYLPDVF